jgi:hypothetical protein
MKLELKHIAPYLPYGLRLQHKQSGDIYKLLMVGKNVNNTYVVDCYVKGELNFTVPARQSIKNFKPILRPLSDLTNYEVQIADIIGLLSAEHVINAIINGHDYIMSMSAHAELSKFMYENHFDVFGLIDKGLAVNINILNGDQ